MSSTSVELLGWNHDCTWHSSKDTTIFLSPSNRKKDVFSGCPLVLSCLLLVVAAAFTVSLILGLRFSATPAVVDPINAYLRDDLQKIAANGRKMQDKVDGQRIISGIRWMAQEVHLAGTPANERLLKRLVGEYTDLRYDVRVFDYNVLLNYPDFSRPNTVEIFDEVSDAWLLVSRGVGRSNGIREAHLQSDDERAIVWWSAYSGNGTVEGRIVYANFFFRHDFDTLFKAGIDVRNCIVLMRFGGVPRMTKVAEAEERGAIGAILFSDPLHTGGTSINHTFPFDMTLPGDDVQRGGLLRSVGDPEIPLMPSLPFVPRDSSEHIYNAGVFPQIPVTPIGSDDASRIMHIMDGKHVEEQRWLGGLSAEYRYTGSRIFRLSVTSHNVRKPIRNIVATWRGKEEPDRWVMLGNHIDAWVNGAIDPATGTSIQLEVARVISETASLFPPRRSIVFCHWDAEEYGLIGSTEWIEQMASVLNVRAVAMINVDHIAGNKTLHIKSVPLLYKVIVDAAESVKQTDKDEMQAGRNSLLSTWLYYGGKTLFNGDRQLPTIGLPGGSSDHERLISFAGVPCADVKMSCAKKSSYVFYHSRYDVPRTVEQLLSPSGQSLSLVAKLCLEISNRLANSLVIPFSPSHYAQALSVWLSRLHSRLEHLGILNELPSSEILLRSLFASVGRFRDATAVVDAQINDMRSGHSSISLADLNRLNDRLLQLERVFLDPHAFSSPLHRHLVFSPSKLSGGRSPFALVVDAALEWSRVDASKKETQLRLVASSIARITLALESGSELLHFG